MISNFINKYSDLAAYNADKAKEYPNISYLETEDEVKWQATEPIDQEHIVAKYDVIGTSNPTKILGSSSNITYMIVDGVEQQSVSTGYTFSSTGTHKVKYKVNSNWNGYRTFYECFNMTSIVIPSGVTSIGEDIFRYCSGLTSVTIPDSVTNIGNRAFANCSGLTSINIPSGVTSIGHNAFYQCSSLTSITVEAINPPTLGNSVFANTNNCPIYVPSASVNAYKAASGWSTYASQIQAIQ